MGPCTGHGSGGTRISSAYNIRWQVSIPSFKCVTFGHVIHKLVQHIPKEGGSEQEGNLSFKFHSIKVCNICYLASIFLESGSQPRLSPYLKMGISRLLKIIGQYHFFRYQARFLKK